MRRDGSEAMSARARYTMGDTDVFAPIVLVEALAIARGFPVLWRRTEDGPELGTLLFLTPGDTPARANFLEDQARPLLLEAYPLAIQVRADEPAVVLIDEQSDPDPSDRMAIFDTEGRPTPDGARKLNCLEVFVADGARTKAVTSVLDRAGLLEDWPLRLQIGGEGVEVEGLCVIARDLRERHRLPPLMEEHGFDLAELVTLHDLSLFNMQRLVDFHRSERLLARAQTAR